MAKARNDISVVVNDSVTIIGNVVSVSGVGSQAVIVVQPQFGSSFSCFGSDCNAPAGYGNALSYSHMQFGLAGDQVSIPATVLAILGGSGSIALVSVKLQSGLVVTITSGSCESANQGGIPPGNV